MWKICKLFFLFVLATVCHWGFATLFSYAELNVNFMLVFAIALCTAIPLEIGYPIVFLCGLFLDFFGVKLFGNNAFLFTLVALIMYTLRDRIDFSGIIPQVVIVFLLTCMVGTCNHILLAWFTPASFWPGVGSLFGGAVVAAFLAPIVFGVVRLVCHDFIADERL